MKGKSEREKGDQAISGRPLAAQRRREEVLDEVIPLLELAIARVRAHRHADAELKALIRAALESVRQELVHLKTAPEQRKAEGDRSLTERAGNAG